MRSATERPLWVESGHATSCPLRFLSPGNCHSGIGQPKSRLLGAHAGRSNDTFHLLKADILSAAFL